MNRRTLVVASILILALVAGVLATRNRTTQAPTARGAIERDARSVVLVTLDTTRPDRLEPYGADNVATPVLARLAARSVVFDQAWAVAPITLVAHTSILAGTNPFEHGVRNNGIHYVPQEVTTLAERLQDEGYRTGAFVSAAVLDRRYGLDQGFEVYDDDLSERRNVSPRMVADRPAEVTVASAKAWLDGLEDDERYFLWVHFYDPHASYSPPPPYRDTYRDRLYDGEIAYMDAQLGELLQHPRLLGTAAGTEADADTRPIVAVIGDHGESLGEHGERTHAILAYDSTLHIPWILHVPGGPAGMRVSEAVGQVDVKPTLLSLLGMSEEPTAAAREPLDNALTAAGRDLTPILEGRAQNPLAPYYAETYLPFYTYGWAKLRVLRRGRWKLIDAPTPELYDQRRDPRELTDLHAIESGVAHDLKRDLDTLLAGADAEQEASLSLDSEAIAKLRSLGYVSVGSGSGGSRTRERPNPMDMIEQHVGLERARALLADRFYPQASRQLEGVLRRDPENLAALIDLVRARDGEGKIEEALQAAERALELDPEYVQTYMLLARLEAQREDLPKALELAGLAVDRDPLNPEAAILEASFLNRLGRREDTEKALRALIEQHPEHPRANAVFAHLVEARGGDLDAAETRLRAAVERDPFLEQAWLFLGRLLERLKRPDEAVESYRRGLVGRPDDAELHGALGHVLAKLGKRDEAIAQLREAIRLSPKTRTELHVSLGAVLGEMGRTDEAEREYQKVLAMDPSHPGARNNAAIALYRSGRIDEAQAALEAIIEAFPRHVDAHNNLAAIAVEQERWSSVVRHSRRTLELAPDLVEAWNNLGIGLEETDKLGDAREAYRKALANDPEYWPAYFNLGFLLKKSGDHQDAVRAFDEVLSRVPSHGETHLEMGELYAGPLANPARARTHWNAFLRHAPAHPRSEEIRQRLQDL